MLMHNEHCLPQAMHPAAKGEQITDRTKLLLLLDHHSFVTEPALCLLSAENTERLVLLHTRHHTCTCTCYYKTMEYDS